MELKRITAAENIENIPEAEKKEFHPQVDADPPEPSPEAVLNTGESGNKSPEYVDEEARDFEIARANARMRKEKEKRRKFNFMKVEEIDRSNTEINDWVANKLVPGLLDFTKSNKYHYSLIRLFHNLGCSASFVFALAGVFHEVAQALQMAVESSEDKIVLNFQDDVLKAERVIMCYRRMYNKFDKSTVFAFNKDDTWHKHHEPLNFISFITPFNIQRTYEK